MAPTPTSTIALYCGLSFLLGSIPFGFLMGRAYGVDLRQQGSGNIGATNTLRTLGKTPGMVVLILDTLKGWLPVALTPALLLTDEQDPSGGLRVLIGVCAVLGHIYSPWVRFRGGKGVATSLGVLIGLAPLVALISLATFASVFAITRRVSLGSMVGAVSQALMLWILPGYPLAIRLFGTLVCAFILVRHRDNIRRLRRGEEKALDLKSPPTRE
jgi:acyl phosphate:glycerol-3-phosphate acyltransferase